jgi:hypothetical protein
MTPVPLTDAETVTGYILYVDGARFSAVGSCAYSANRRAGYPLAGAFPYLT